MPMEPLFMFMRYAIRLELTRANQQLHLEPGLMRHSKISLTMNTNTDATLLETSAAIEQIQLLKFEPRTVAPTVAPTTAQNSQNQSIPDTFEDLVELSQGTKKPCDSQGITGFLKVGLAGFEPTTSTTPR
jgi:hypothetical protein